MKRHTFIFLNGRQFSVLTKLNNVKEYEDNIIKCIEKVKTLNPLVHCITNRVTTEKVANSLLAFGASPAMIDNPKEVKEFASVSSCTYLNAGLHTTQVENIKILEKIRKDKSDNKFILILDPIAIGATSYRTDIIKEIIKKCKPNIIKGNLSEIVYIDKEKFYGKGVDSSNSINIIAENEAINSARRVALKHNCTVVLTSKTDIIVSPCANYIAKINYDLNILEKLTGSGCAIGGLCAAASAVLPTDMFIACTAATLLYKLAASKAYETEKNPGTLNCKIIDYIYSYSNNSQLLNFNILSFYKATSTN
ncbi:hydroxyethylthiazole kinase, putative [Hepatocystis sp. ex Piliocolobus tephrosceles]|nr:hydroxyethylthiazole kinase, putative [Hepatocystis sp. ex Piliocolobus tephrosceles]